METIAILAALAATAGVSYILGRRTGYAAGYFVGEIDGINATVDGYEEERKRLAVSVAKQFDDANEAAKLRADLVGNNVPAVEAWLAKSSSL